MRLSVTATVAALCASAQAFSDTSPFLLFSTSKLENSDNLGREPLQPSSRVLASTKQLLASCPTDRYLLVSQPNLNLAHLESQTSSTSSLTDALGGAEDAWTVAEVAGELELKQIASYIREHCGVKSSAIDEIGLAPLPSAGSEAVLADNDDKLGMVMEQYKAEGSYTVIYTGGPRTEHPEEYKPEFQQGHTNTELKRHLNSAVRRQDKSRDTRPLFEKYQYFTPGIFMGLITLIVLLSILYAGIGAVASLQVPYGAFEKDMGPAAQKKAQ
ncbi:BIG1-domain-containing protein [Xylariaceae sp. FL0804]|nr:BIG1-domain-containing protein [Xylariaceae sp. FL0804]